MAISEPAGKPPLSHNNGNNVAEKKEGNNNKLYFKAYAVSHYIGNSPLINKRNVEYTVYMFVCLSLLFFF